MTEEVLHQTLNSKYRIVFEQVGSSTKSILGFKVEANSDNLDEAQREAAAMLAWAKEMAPAPVEKEK